MPADISCCLGCPFEGDVPAELVAELSKALHAGGCSEIVISDTIGTGTPGSMAKALERTLAHGVPVEDIAVHCHDTCGQAGAVIFFAMAEYGITSVEAAVAGLGGCPYAPGASGNAATEDVVHLLHGAGVHTGVDLPALLDVSRWVEELFAAEGHAIPGSAVARAAQPAP